MLWFCNYESRETKGLGFIFIFYFLRVIEKGKEQRVMLENCFYKQILWVSIFRCKMFMLISILFTQMSNGEEKASLWLKMVFVEHGKKAC